MKKKFWARLLLLGFVILTVVMNLLYLSARWLIQSSLDEISFHAQQAHPGSPDVVAALILEMNSESLSWNERNQRVWALGQLRDPAALPALQAYYHGGTCDHAHDFCQDELRKAIRLCSGETPNFLFIHPPK